MANSDTEQLLSFGDFPMTASASASTPAVAQMNVNSPNHSRGRTDDNFLEIVTTDAGSGPGTGSAAQKPEETASTKHSFLSFEFYQQYFNVDTFMVLDRIASSIIPKRAPVNYLRTVIGDAPDLYGPIWIVLTLVFSIAITGNVSRYLQTAGSLPNGAHWHYNFHLVSLAATVIIIYVCGVAGGLWALFKWSLKAVDPNFETDTSSYTPSLLSLLCVYGYSLAIYIPVSVLWMIPFGFLQWLLVITAATLSGAALVIILRPAIRNSRFSAFLVIGIVAAHFLLACSFMTVFFHVPGGTAAVVEVAQNVVVAGIKDNSSAVVANQSAAVAH